MYDELENTNNFVRQKLFNCSFVLILYILPDYKVRMYILLAAREDFHATLAFIVSLSDGAVASLTAQLFPLSLSLSLSLLSLHYATHARYIICIRGFQTLR